MLVRYGVGTHPHIEYFNVRARGLDLRLWVYAVIQAAKFIGLTKCGTNPLMYMGAGVRNYLGEGLAWLLISLGVKLIPSMV